MRFAQAFTDAIFEEDVVGNDDGGAAVLLQDGEDVLEEVELFVTCVAFAICSPMSVVDVEIADFQVPNPPCCFTAFTHSFNAAYFALAC